MYINSNKGQVNVSKVRKEDFEVNTDSLGRKYIRMNTKRLTNNHYVDHITDHDDKKGRIYENPGKIYMYCFSLIYQNHMSHQT